MQDLFFDKKGADGQPEIILEEVDVVRRIFSRYLLEQSVRQIARDLMADGIKTASGKDTWNDNTIQNGLRNEQYIGDALLQKTFVEDMFSLDRRIEEISETLDETCCIGIAFDELTARQMISNIKVVDKERILIRFKDGSEIEQMI